MLYDVTLILAAAVYGLGLIVACSTAPILRRIKCGITPTHILIVGTFLGLALYFFPMAYTAHGESLAFSELFPTVVSSVIRAMGVFAGEGDYFGAIEEFARVAPALTVPYRIVGVLLHISAPLLTLGFILSFVKNFSARLRYRFSFLRVAHIFSELNAHSLAMAESIVSGKGFFSRPVIVFTDVVDKQGEEDYDLVSEAEKLGAILFRKDLESISFRLFPFGRRLFFYLLQDKQVERRKGEGEKLRHATHIMERYDARGVTLYIFSGSKESELFLNAKRYRRRCAPAGRAREAIAANPAACRGERRRLLGLLLEWEELCSMMPKRQRVIRLDDVRSLIYHDLDTYGHRLFENAARTGGRIHSVIVGLGQYGTEMLRALSWYTQVPGFSLTITAFDGEKTAKDRLALAVPELMSRAALLGDDGAPERGNSNCRLSVYPEVDTETSAFYERLAALEGVTHVFVALGNDRRNIATAAAIRAFFRSRGDTALPDIETVVYDSGIAETMGAPRDGRPEDPCTAGACVRKTPYRIHMLGDVKSFYSVDTLLSSDVLEAGLRTHIRFEIQYARIYVRLDLAEQRGRLAELGAGQEASPERAEEIAALEREIIAGEQAEAELTRELLELYSYCNPEGGTPTREQRAAYARLRRKYADGFFTNEYNHRSSLAKAMGERLRGRLFAERAVTAEALLRDIDTEALSKIYNAECPASPIGTEEIRAKATPEFLLAELAKPWDTRDGVALLLAGAIEHVRWNAYMRSEGYSYGDATDHFTKRHHDLRNVSEMTLHDLRKDV